MFHPRKIESHPSWADTDGIKIYTISAKGQPVDHAPCLARLTEIKKQKSLDWSSTPAFAVFHDGASMAYLVLAWWGNDNELITSVSVLTAAGWVEDPVRYSFCLYDLEVMWQERNYFIECLDCSSPDLAGYRAKRFTSTTPLHAVSASFATAVCLAIFAHLRRLLRALLWEHRPTFARTEARNGVVLEPVMNLK